MVSKARSGLAEHGAESAKLLEIGGGRKRVRPYNGAMTPAAARPSLFSYD